MPKPSYQGKSQIQQPAAKGEIRLPEGTSSAKVTFKNGALPQMLEGDGALVPDGNDYSLTLPAGGYAFIYFA